jgi:hypothetical protein
VYNPDDHDPGTNPMDQYVADKGVEGNLDGTWVRSNQIDYWDGSAPGETTPPDDPEPKAPGGVEIRSRPGEGLSGQTIQTISFEDTGDPRADDYADPSNRKIYLARRLDPAADAVDGGRLAEGITVYARFRLTPDPRDVADAPIGMPLRRRGNTPIRGPIMLLYYDGDPDADAGNGSKSWAMGLYEDALQLVDEDDITGLKPGEWVSVWLTMQDVNGNGRYHNNLFLNGDTVPIRADWRTDLRDWEEDLFGDRTFPFSALCMGMLSTGPAGAMEVDFVKVKYAEVFPESAVTVPGITGLSCVATDDTVTLSWTNGDTYDRAEVKEGLTVRAVLTGGENQAVLTGVADGQHTYTVVGQKDGILTPESSCTVTVPPDGTGEEFKRGDANADGGVNIADAVYILQNLFAQGAAITCPDAGDANDDEGVNIADAVYILQNLFAQGAAIPAPGTEACGPDTTGDPGGGPDLGPCNYCPGACLDPPQPCR